MMITEVDFAEIRWCVENADLLKRMASEAGGMSFTNRYYWGDADDPDSIDGKRVLLAGPDVETLSWNGAKLFWIPTIDDVLRLLEYMDCYPLIRRMRPWVENVYNPAGVRYMALDQGYENDHPPRLASHKTWLLAALELLKCVDEDRLRTAYQEGGGQGEANG